MIQCVEGGLEVYRDNISLRAVIVEVREISIDREDKLHVDRKPNCLGSNSLCSSQWQHTLRDDDLLENFASSGPVIRYVGSCPFGFVHWSGEGLLPCTWDNSSAKREVEVLVSFYEHPPGHDDVKLGTSRERITLSEDAGSGGDDSIKEAM